jgi:hypothetical protein
MAVHSHRTWHTLQGEGRRLTSGDGDQLYHGMQVRIDPDGGYGYRYLEELDREQDCWMCVAFTRDRSIVGQTFGKRKKDARQAMEALFRLKGLGSTGLTL